MPGDGHESLGGFYVKRSNDAFETPTPNSLMLPDGRVIEVHSVLVRPQNFTCWGLSTLRALPPNYIRIRTFAQTLRYTKRIKSTMHHIRPYKLFTLIEAPPSERIIQTALPCRRGAGGVSQLEMSLILAASRIVEAKRVFEFGTFLGSTTFNLALNIPDDGTVFTLDLDEHHAGEAKQDVADAPLTAMHLASKSSLDFAGSLVARKIRTLVGNSTTFDFSLAGLVDLVFIDGGHDFDTVKSDSENALRMACNLNPAHSEERNRIAALD